MLLCFELNILWRRVGGRFLIAFAVVRSMVSGAAGIHFVVLCKAGNMDALRVFRAWYWQILQVRLLRQPTCIWDCGAGAKLIDETVDSLKRVKTNDRSLTWYLSHPCSEVHSKTMLILGWLLIVGR